MYLRWRQVDQSGDGSAIISLVMLLRVLTTGYADIMYDIGEVIDQLRADKQNGGLS